MINALNQVLQWTLIFINRFGPVVAVGLGAYWLWLLYRRTFESTTDPSYKKWYSTGIGSMSMLVTGAFLSAAIAGLIAFLTWPAPVETPLFGLVLIAGVVFHAAVEKQEDMEGT